MKLKSISIATQGTKKERKSTRIRNDYPIVPSFVPSWNRINRERNERREISTKRIGKKEIDWSTNAVDFEPIDWWQLSTGQRPVSKRARTIIDHVNAVIPASKGSRCFRSRSHGRRKRRISHEAPEEPPSWSRGPWGCCWTRTTEPSCSRPAGNSTSSCSRPLKQNRSPFSFRIAR